MYYKSGLHIIFCALVSIVLTACADIKHQISILPNPLEIEVGEIVSLKLYDGEEELGASYAEWTTTDENIAYISAGLVQGISEGVAVVSATYKGSKAECIVFVGKTEAKTDECEDLDSAVKYLSKSNKRGVGYNFAQFPAEDVAALSPFVSWCYNWGQQPSSAEISELLDEAGIDFIPMAWNGFNAEIIRSYKKSHPNCMYILAYNEPNLIDQANMTPQEAASKWPELKALAAELGLKIVSPAMNYGTLAGYHDPVIWLDEFFAQDGVSLDDVCAIALHCYMSSASAMYSYVHKFDKYNLPIWMTEFCSWDSPSPINVQGQTDYMNETVVMLEAEPMVERYAWFIPRASGAVDSYPYMQLLSKTDIGELSIQGKIYAALTSFDKSIWLDSSFPILPNVYSDCSAANAICNGMFETAPLLRESTDCAGELMLCGLTNGKWIEYQIEVKQSVGKLLLRYEGITKSTLRVYVDGVENGEYALAWSDSKWVTEEMELPLSQGKHTLRFEVNGNIYLSWFRLI